MSDLLVGVQHALHDAAEDRVQVLLTRLLVGDPGRVAPDAPQRDLADESLAGRDQGRRGWGRRA